MIYNYEELKKIVGSGYKIKKSLKLGKLFKIDKGIYSSKKNNHYLEIFAKKYPDAIISSDSALYYHNLTDIIPDKIYITTTRTAGRYKDKRIKQSFSTDKFYNLGKTVLEVEGVKINTYDKERLLLELVKNKNNAPYDYYKEIINNYRNIIDKLDVYKLEVYSKSYSNGKKLMQMIQDEVF